MYFNSIIKNENIFNLLLTQAKTSDFTSHRHSAAIVYKKKVLSIGCNQIKTHPLMLKYQTDEHKIHLHAEIDAIIKAINLHGSEILKRCELYVLRLTGGGNVGHSKPCRGCQKAIDAFGFKGVYWT
jgi:deoxycytidylate deaminase